MDLWLRLQNKKTLIKVNSEISTNGYGRIFVNGDNKIATYKTEERALEVLDEIQKLLMGQDIIIFHNTELESYENMQQLYKHIKNNKWVCVCNDAKIEYIAPSTIVYEMPEK